MRDLHTKLQRLYQGYKSVEAYYKEMDTLLLRLQLVETPMATMSRFLHGLNRDIQDILELHTYDTLDEMVHKAIKIEAQLKRNCQYKRNYKERPSSSTWVDKEKDLKEEHAKPTHKENKNYQRPKVSSSNSTLKESNIKCFKCLGKGHIASQCPNKIAMVMRQDGGITSEESSGSSSEKEDQGETQSTFSEEAEEGDLLMVRRLLKLNHDLDDTQRENIFHTRCLVNEKICVVIIDSGSCTNVASSIMVEKLGMRTTKHPNPYRLQWLNDGGEIRVTKQALVPFTIGKYKDEVLCDVVSMDACHLLLGRLWQYDKGTTHDGITN